MTQRDPRQHDAKHLAFVRLQPCCVCGKAGPSEAAHLRMACPARGKRSTGMQEKPHDKWTTPLCPYHHRTGICAQHKMGEAAFWEMVGRDPFAIALSLWAASGGEERAAQRRPLKPRKTAVRAPREKRRKIHGRTQIVSRGFPKIHRPMERRA